jgi:hypothetical protein
LKGALPFRLAAGSTAPEIEWVWADAERFTEPFFEQTIARLRRTNPANRSAVCPRAPLGALHHFPAGLPLRGLVFHVSRCGSTLLCQMLAAVPRNRVVSEPQILDDLLRSDRRGREISEEEKITLLRGAIAALGQPLADGAERLFVKLDCWHLLQLPLIRRAFPNVPLAFVYRDPVEVLVSLMRMPSLTMARETIRTEDLEMTEAERQSLSAVEHAAAILRAFYRAARRHRNVLTPVAYADLPTAALNAFPSHSSDQDEETLMLAAAASDAKNPGQRFTPDATTKRRAASPEILAAAEKWTARAYADWLACV